MSDSASSGDASQHWLTQRRFFLLMALLLLLVTTERFGGICRRSRGRLSFWEVRCTLSDHVEYDEENDEWVFDCPNCGSEVRSESQTEVARYALYAGKTCLECDDDV